METLDTTKIISDDLKKAGYMVATNKRNTLGLPRFHTKGVGNSVPDLYFWNPNYKYQIYDPEFSPNGISQIRNGFIETKSGDYLNELIEGVFQNTRYYGYFITNKAQFSINGSHIYNVDCFLLGTSWSRTGMIYKGDDTLIPLTIAYLSERYNLLMYPFTMMIHSLQRYYQNLQRNELRNKKLKIAPNKTKVQTGILISKTPYDENLEISYEYYAWMGNMVRILHTNHQKSHEFIKTSYNRYI